MTIAFPNRSRSFDSGHGRVRFSGYDGMFQVQYYLEADALISGRQGSDNEAGILAAFDAQWDRIVKAASKAYTSTRRSSYTLTRADL